MKNHCKINTKGRLRSLVLLCFLVLATLRANATPGEVEYFDNGDGTAGFRFPKDFFYHSDGDAHSYDKIVVEKTWSGLPVKTYDGYLDGMPRVPYYEDGHMVHDYETIKFYNTYIDTLIVKAEIEAIQKPFPDARVIFFPKTLKYLDGAIMNWYEWNELTTTREVYFESGSNLERIGDNVIPAGYASFLKKFEIPRKVRAIGDFCFYGNYDADMFDYPLPPNLQEIGQYSFYNCCLYDKNDDERDNILTIPASVKVIGKGAFQNAMISTLILQGGANLLIEEGAFNDTKIVISKTEDPFRMRYAETTDTTTYFLDESLTQPPYCTQEVWGGERNFPKIEVRYNQYKKPRLYVPVGCRDVYGTFRPVDDETVTYDDIFDIVEGVTWGTIVVPQNNKGAIVTGIARLAELKSCDVKDGDNWRLVFDEIPVTFDTKLTAGKPYICVPPSIPVTGSSTVTPVTVTDNGYTVTFTGNLTNGSSHVPNGAYYFGGATGKCYLNEREDNVVTLGNGRCYFEVTAPSSAKPLTMSVVMNELDGSRSDVTAIGDVFMTQNKDVIPGGDATYNLQGVRMSNSGTLPKGIYIRNGKKVVVK